MENRISNLLTPEDIGFESLVVENIPVDEILDLYNDGCYVVINVCFDYKTRSGSFVEVICKDSKREIIKGKARGNSSINIYLAGLRDVIERVDNNTDIIFITPTQVGLKGGFACSGANGHLVYKLLNMVKDKNCSLKEIYYPGGVEEIRKYIKNYAELPDKVHNKPKSNKEVYNNCIQDVLHILRVNNVGNRVLKQVLDLKKL